MLRPTDDQRRRRDIVCGGDVGAYCTFVDAAAADVGGGCGAAAAAGHDAESPNPVGKLE